MNDSTKGCLLGSVYLIWMATAVVASIYSARLFMRELEWPVWIEIAIGIIVANAVVGLATQFVLLPLALLGVSLARVVGKKEP